MKVCVIGGSPVYSYHLCKALSEQGVDVSAVLDKEHYRQEFEDGNFEIKKLFSSDDGYLPRIWKLIKYLKNTSPDIVHFQSTFSPRRDWIFCHFLHFLKRKVVYTAHNIIPHEVARFEKFALKIIYHQIPSIIVHAERNKESLIKEFGVDPGKIHIIPHGTFSFYKKFTRGLTMKEARVNLRLPEKEEIILFFGVIRKAKGLQYLLKAQKIIHSKLPFIKLVIAGPPWNINLLEYKKIIKNLKIENSVIFRPYLIPLEEVGAYFVACNLVALPYLQCTQSGVAFTALAYGRPVVATDVGGLPEVIEDEGNGYIVSPQNESKLAEAIIKVLTDEEKMKYMGENAVSLAEKKYSWEKIASKTIRVYKRLWKV